MHLILLPGYVIDFWFLLLSYACMWDMYTIITNCFVLRVEKISNVVFLVELIIGPCIVDSPSYVLCEVKFYRYYFDDV